MTALPAFRSAPAWLGDAVRGDFAERAGLDARRRLYRYERPTIDVAGLAADALAGCSGVIVDVGCGTGAVLRLLQDRVGIAVGVDLSPEMLRAVRGRGQRPLLQADAAALPLLDDCANAAVAAHMLYLVPDPLAALAEMARVVRPGGVLVVTTTGGDDKPLVAELLEEALAGLLPAAERRARDVHRRFDIAAAVAGLNGLGLDAVVRDARAEICMGDAKALREYVHSLQPLFSAALPPERWAAGMRRLDAALEQRIRRTGWLTTPTHVGVVAARRPPVRSETVHPATA